MQVRWRAKLVAVWPGWVRRVQSQPWQALEKYPQANDPFQASQRCSQTEVFPNGKREMLISLLAAEIKNLRVCEMGRVTIGRAHHALHRLAWSQFNAFYLYRARDMAGTALDGRFPAQRFLDCLCKQ